MREHWREIDYWWWLWRERVATEAKVALGLLLVAVLLAGGWLAADRLTAARAGELGANDAVLETTVQKVVTVHDRGRVVKRVVPLVKRVYLHPSTAFETQTQLQLTTRVVTAPGTVRVVRRLVTTRVPVVKKEVVTVKGKTRTTVTTRLVPTTRVQTQTLTQTQTQTQTRVVTNQQTVTNTRDVTQPVTVRKTDTTTLPAVTRTETQVQTQTQTQVQTVTQTQVQTQTVTETTQVPGPTVTVTVTGP